MGVARCGDGMGCLHVLFGRLQDVVSSLFVSCELMLSFVSLTKTSSFFSFSISCGLAFNSARNFCSIISDMKNFPVSMFLLKRVLIADQKLFISAL